MKVREVLRLLAADGWVTVRTRGSHRRIKHPTKKKLVTVAGNESKDLPPKTLRSILRQAELELPDG